MRNSAAYLDRTSAGIVSYFKIGNNGIRPSSRTDSAGKLIRGLLQEKAGTNLITYSDALSSWDATYCSITADNASSPDNYKSLDLISEDAMASANHCVSLASVVASSSNSDYCFSAKMKKTANRTFAALGVTLGSGNSPIGYFNLATGATATMTYTTSYGIKSLGSDWYLCWISWYDAGSVSLTPTIYVASADGTISFNGGDQTSIYAGDAQLEIGTYPSSLIDTSAATAIRATDHPVCFKGDDGNLDTLTGDGVEGAIELKVLGPPVPPAQCCDLIELSDSGNSYNKIKLYADCAGRPCLYINKKVSSTYATFDPTYGTVTDGQTDPEGGILATLFTEDDAETAHSMTANPTGFIGTGEVAIWLKYAGRRYVRFYWAAGAVNDYLTVDLLTGEAYAIGGTTPTRYGDYGIHKYPDGWIRAYFITDKIDTSENAFTIVSIADDGTSTTATGLDGDAFYLYCASVTEKADNLLSLNNDITGYTLTNVTVANATGVTDPMGTELADCIHEIDSAAGSPHYATSDNDKYNVVSTKKYKISASLKAANRNWCRVALMTSPGSGIGGCWINLTTGIQGTIYGTEGTIYKIEINNLGNDWYKLNVIFKPTANQSNTVIRIMLGEADNDATFDGLNQDSIYVYGIRLEEYPSEIEVVGTPTNLLDNNYSFSSSYWTKTRCSITKTAQLDPFGTYTAEVLNEGSDASNTHYILKGYPNYPIGTNICQSIFVKPIYRTWLRFYMTDSVGAPYEGYFNLSGAGVAGYSANLITSGISYINNGWYLCWIALSIVRTYGGSSFIISIAEGNIDNTFSGTGNDSFYICNPVLETGVTTRTRFNICDGKIHRVVGCWKNGYAAVEVDSQITGAPSTSILTANIPDNLDRIDIGPSNGIISELSLFPGAQGRK